MKERGIIFNAEMVRAILDGRKTQTRRVMKVQPVLNGDRWEVYSASVEKGNKSIPVTPWGSIENNCPFGKVGDRLWVRETFGNRVVRDALGGTGEFITYRASEPDAVYCTCASGDDIPMKWKPSIHMPRWASRITLEITDVRVERLNDISNDDAKSEGCWYGRGGGTPDKALTPSDQFPTLWEEIYGDGSWSSNPWVWVIEFKRI
ncbi:MAG: hypothetical protein SO066_07965 [Proteus mirabilis]|nr:hypothetical protein [Proteus mirabilis]